MGLWSKKAEKGFGQFIDDKLKLPIWVEPFDGLIATYGIGWLDNTYSKKIPEVLHPFYVRVGLAFEKYNDNKELVIEDFLDIADVVVVLNTLIDIPNMSEEDEAVFMAGVLGTMFTMIKNYLIKVQQGKNE